MAKRERVLSLRAAMERKLELLNLGSLSSESSEDSSRERRQLEVSIRRLGGVTRTVFWRLSLSDAQIVQFRRSIKLWLFDHKAYSFATKVLYDVVEHAFYLEAPIQIATPLNEWLKNYWGMDDCQLSKEMPLEKISGFVRTSI